MNEEPKPKTGYKKATIALSILCIILVGVLIWCWWYHPGGSGPVTTTPPKPSGPCTDGADNTLPDGFTFYENPTLGYRFAYPNSWGSVTVTTTPIASETGNYVMGKFSANDKVWFGGNALDYVVRGRDGIPTDLPGYLKAGGKYYTVELWKYSDGATTEDRNDLHPINPPYEEKAGCNTTALVTHFGVSEVSSVGPAKIAHFNLKSTSPYYGVNFVLDKPTGADTEQFNKLIKSFELQ